MSLNQCMPTNAGSGDENIVLDRPLSNNSDAPVAVQKGEEGWSTVKKKSESHAIRQEATTWVSQKPVKKNQRNRKTQDSAVTGEKVKKGQEANDGQPQVNGTNSDVALETPKESSESDKVVDADKKPEYVDAPVPKTNPWNKSKKRGKNSDNKKMKKMEQKSSESHNEKKSEQQPPVKNVWRKMDKTSTENEQQSRSNNNNNIKSTPEVGDSKEQDNENKQSGKEAWPALQETVYVNQAACSSEANVSSNVSSPSTTKQKSKKAKTLGSKKTAKTEIASTEKANEHFSDSSSSKDNDTGDKSKPTTPGGGQKKGRKKWRPFNNAVEVKLPRANSGRGYRSSRAPGNVNNNASNAREGYDRNSRRRWDGGRNGNRGRMRGRGRGRGHPFSNGLKDPNVPGDDRLHGTLPADPYAPVPFVYLYSDGGAYLENGLPTEGDLSQMSMVPANPNQEIQNCLQAQLSYYFTEENLTKDIYLRNQMDSEGYVPVSLLAGFNRIKQLTNEEEKVYQALAEVPTLQVNGNKVRLIEDPERWVLSNNSNYELYSPTSSPSQPQPAPQLSLEASTFWKYVDVNPFSPRTKSTADAESVGSTKAEEEPEIIDNNGSEIVEDQEAEKANAKTDSDLESWIPVDRSRKNTERSHDSKRNVDRKEAGDKKEDVREELNFMLDEEYDQLGYKKAHLKYHADDDDDLSDTEVEGLVIITQVSRLFGSI